MKTFRQLLRQPIKTLFGVILVTLAVAVLCICLGQSITAQNMEDNMDEVCTSTGLLTETYMYTSAYYESVGRYLTIFSRSQPEEVITWLEDMAREYPDIVETINEVGLASAYVPELTADNAARYFAILENSGTSNLYVETLSSNMHETNYTHAMLEITLDEIGEVQANYAASKYNTLVQGIAVELTGTIENVLALEEGFTDPIGYTARMTLILPDEAALEALNLEVGGRYLVYGMDYRDLDWEVRSDIAVKGHGVGNDISAENPKIERFYEENWEPFQDGYVEGMGWAGLPEYNVGWYNYEQVMSDGTIKKRGIHLTNLDMEKFRTIELSLFNTSDLNEKTDSTYSVPTIVRLENTAEAFLASDEGAFWQQYLDYTIINHHSFAVLGVENLMATGNFALEKASITAGRNFTKEELASGAKVCVISEEVAALSGLQVGDKITFNFYNYDYDYPYQEYISEGYGIVNPGAYAYGSTTEFNGAAEVYTVIGLYSRGTAWEIASSLYDFTVNTIFAPKASITSDMDTSSAGLFLSVVAHNGSIDDLEALSVRDGFEGLFETTDQGYETIIKNLHNYKAIAKQAAIVGISVYGIIILLFMLLYPSMQTKNLATMGALGAERKNKLCFLMGNSLGLLVPGTLLGMLTGMVLWDKVTASLIQSARVTLDLSLKPQLLLSIALGQLLFAALLALAFSIPLTKHRSLMNKQGVLKNASDRLQRTPLAGWSIVVFAAIISIVLCSLHAANEEEYANYETAVREAPVYVTLTDPRGKDPYKLGASGFIMDIFYDERFASFTPMKYLKDFQYMTHLKVNSVNNEHYSSLAIYGITSHTLPPNLSVRRDCVITWRDGYDSSCLDSEDEMFLLIPEQKILEDIDPETPGDQVKITLVNSVFGGYYGSDAGELQGTPMYYDVTYETIATVAGTYTNSIDSPEIYCSFEPLLTCGLRVQQVPSLDYFSATLKNNEDIEALRIMCNQWFKDPDNPDMVPTNYKGYTLVINDETLINLKVSLENSIAINKICTLLVFVLSAGAGFFLGFLMIRSRKREIILMRTLGKPNLSIYVQYAVEQMLCIIGGTLLGGAVFGWQPPAQLGIFIGIYFVGLSTALLVFLHSRLLTNMKEES